MQTFGWGSGVESLGHLVPMRYRFAFVAAALRNLILCPKLAVGGERGDNRFRKAFNLRSLKTSLVCNLKDNNMYHTPLMDTFRMLSPGECKTV